MARVKRPTQTFLGVTIFAFALYYFMIYLQQNVLTTNLIPDYIQMEQGAASGNPIGWLMWILGDMSEPNFFKSYIAGGFLIIGSLVAHYLYKRKSKYQGFPIAYGSGLWPWMLAASTLSLLLSNLLYGWNIAETGWFPTFVTFVSCAAATVLLYGGRWRVVFTGAIAGAILVVPISRLVMVYICVPAGLPGVAGSVAGMWLGTAIACEIYKLLPWMTWPTAPEADQENPSVDLVPDEKHIKPQRFFVRRLIADFSEPIFAGNEIAGALLILGGILSWVLCPGLLVYGSGTFPALLLGEILTGAVAIYVYWDHWMENPWFPSFPSMVSVAPSLIWLNSASLSVAIIAAVLGGLICPGIANFIIQRLPDRWPSVVGTTFSMTAGTIVVAMFITCAKGIIPGL